MHRKTVLKWELAGIVFLIAVGSLLHFLFDWSGQNPLVGMISPVNESLWEHLKLGFWSLILFSLIEYRFIKHYSSNFFLAKGLGIITLQATVLVIHYTYKS